MPRDTVVSWKTFALFVLFPPLVVLAVVFPPVLLLAVRRFYDRVRPTRGRRGGRRTRTG